MSKDLAFVTVIGKDRKGIVATIATELYKANVNIEDLMSKVMDGYFVMAIMVDLSDCNCSKEELRKRLEQAGKKMGLRVAMMHYELFKAMHRV